MGRRERKIKKSRMINCLFTFGQSNRRAGSSGLHNVIRSKASVWTSSLNPMFGICEYCTFTNSFHPGFCTAPSGPVNKRRVFLGWSGIGDYYSVHALFTCDRYRVNELWKDLILKNAVEGHAPANFDPETWEALEHIDGTPTAKTVGGPASQTKGRTGGRGRKRGGKKGRAGAKTNFHV